ncbi:MAG: hypothetical protein GY711_32520 [bacterium]|nr:hypothetical protein [bacterium]
MQSPLARAVRTSAASSLLVAVTAPATHAQVTFSIDNHGPTIGAADAFFGFPITEGDILTPATGPPFVPNGPALGAPLPPALLISVGFGPPGPGLAHPAHAACAGHAPATPCPVEVDALSYGLEMPVPSTPTPPGTYWFSVDEYAVGFPGPIPPNTASEGALGPALEASADVFNDLGMPVPAPLPPFAVPPGNTAVIDGNGLPSGTGFVYPGVGIVEPDAPAIPPDVGDNLDAVDIDLMAVVFPIYYSLDGPFVDPLNGFPNQGSAAVLGLSGADVLTAVVPGAFPAVWAPAPALGLDIAGGPMSDDLDALALWENGTGAFEPAPAPYAWLGVAGPPTDMLLFSVRRGSAVIGMPDSMFGIPIEEGDILSTPVVGGVSPFPSIFIAAENLGLATVRTGTPGPFGPFGDDLDALDVPFPIFTDCNGNGVPDATDIASGTSADCNTNGIPDECDITAGTSADCNSNGIPDECDIAASTSSDCNGNGVPDECEPDCNSNGVPDDCDIAAGTSMDCNSNGIPDECDIAAGTSSDCNGNGVPDECETDCNSNGVPDDCDIAVGTSMDCNSNGIPDECDIAAGTSSDCNGNGMPDECETDCNSNGVPDDCDIASGTSTDCNGNGLPDECEQIGVNYCGPATLNSSGLPAVISAAGVAVPGTSLVLQANQLPANQFGYFLTSRNQGLFMPPASQGFICLGANIGRYNGMVQNSGASGSFCVTIGTASMPTNPPQPVLVGQAWNFQCWFRDQNPGVTSNFTDAITVQY